MTTYVHNVPGIPRIKSPVVKYDGGTATEMVRLSRVSVRAQERCRRGCDGELPHST